MLYVFNVWQTVALAHQLVDAIFSRHGGKGRLNGGQRLKAGVGPGSFILRKQDLAGFITDVGQCPRRAPISCSKSPLL